MCNDGNPGGTNGTPLSNIIATVLAVRTPPSGIVHGYRLNNANIFVQDDFKATSRLTLNLGLRWEFDGYPTDKYGNLTNIWLSQIQKFPFRELLRPPAPIPASWLRQIIKVFFQPGFFRVEQRPDPHRRAVEQFCSAYRLCLAAHREQQTGGARWLRFLL